MSAIVIIEGGVCQESTEDVIVIDLDNIRGYECPHCGAQIDDTYCAQCSIDWDGASFAEIRRVYGQDHE